MGEELEWEVPKKEYRLPMWASYALLVVGSFLLIVGLPLMILGFFSQVR